MNQICLYDSKFLFQAVNQNVISPYHTASSPSLAPSPKTSSGAISMVSGSGSNGLHSGLGPTNSHSDCLDYGGSTNTTGSIMDKSEGGSTGGGNPVTEHSSSGLPGHLSSSAAWKYQSFQVL